MLPITITIIATTPGAPTARDQTRASYAERDYRGEHGRHEHNRGADFEGNPVAAGEQVGAERATQQRERADCEGHGRCGECENGCDGIRCEQHLAHQHKQGRGERDRGDGTFPPEDAAVGVHEHLRRAGGDEQARPQDPAEWFRL